MIRIGLIGAAGQLGLCMIDAAQTAKNIKIIPIPREEIDLNTEITIDHIQKYLELHPCDVVVNAAAYTAVDGAESDIASAYTINEKSPRILAAACHTQGLPFIHISSDYVFDGLKNTPYTEDDAPHPLSVYGKSKECGEVAVRDGHPKSIIIRSAWLFSAYRKNFLKTMLELGQKRSELSIVSDQMGSPTYAPDLALAVLTAARAACTPGADIFGTYHFAGIPETSWHGFATEIFTRAQQHGLKTPAIIQAIPTSAYPLPAKRPVYSVLSSSRFTSTFGIKASDWRTGINDALTILISKKEI